MRFESINNNFAAHRLDLLSLMALLNWKSRFSPNAHMYTRWIGVQHKPIYRRTGMVIRFPTCLQAYLGRLTPNLPSLQGSC